MAPLYSLKFSLIVKEYQLTWLHQATDYEQLTITTFNVTRPGLPLAGCYDFFEHDQIQIIGKMETAYLQNLDPVQRRANIERYMSSGVKAVIICHGITAEIDMVDCARKYNVNLLSTDLGTSAFMAQVITTLRTHLAERQTVHGVLVQVHGEGVLITGESGIGKSETGLELVKRGHRLVADDAVEIRRINRYEVRGEAPEMIRYLMELRGVGLIDVRRIYGVGSVLEDSKIDMVAHFEKWETAGSFDRLGLEDETIDYLGVKVPHITVPVAPARNLAIIIEVAAINNRQKRMGFNTAMELVSRHDTRVDSGWQSMKMPDER